MKTYDNISIIRIQHVQSNWKQRVCTEKQNVIRMATVKENNNCI